MENTQAWQLAWQEGFKINTNSPSKISLSALKIMPKNEKVLDVACGNGRNSAFFARQGFEADAFDIAEIYDPKSLQIEVSKRIHFRRCTADEFDYQPNRYVAVIAARFIQYLTEADLNLFLRKVSSTLQPNGVFALSYALGEGGLSGEQFKVVRFSHDPVQLKEQLMQNAFEIVEFNNGASNTVHLAQNVSRETYDIIARKINTPE